VLKEVNFPDSKRNKINRSEEKIKTEEKLNKKKKKAKIIVTLRRYM